MAVHITPTEIAEVLEIEPVVHEDERGFFLESYHKEHFVARGIACEFVQDNHARSRRGTLRGLHFQRSPGQHKLVRVSHGVVFDVVVDVRVESPTFGRWVSRELSDENRRMLYVPAGFAHGYAVLSELADVHYKVSHPYVPSEEAGIAWDDPDLGIDWPVRDPILSPRDRALPRWRELFPGQLFPRRA
jgi:dTDP-4-dehydrorhamnose 3,5-epimerase